MSMNLISNSVGYIVQEMCEWVSQCFATMSQSHEHNNERVALVAHL